MNWTRLINRPWHSAGTTLADERPASRVSPVGSRCWVLELWSGSTTGLAAPGLVRESVWCQTPTPSDTKRICGRRRGELIAPRCLAFVTCVGPSWPPRSQRPRLDAPSASSNHAQLDWHVWRWGGCILKGGNIRTGAACRRGASAKGACKFLTCPAYVNEPFFPLWYNYYEGILPSVGRSVSCGTYLMGVRRGGWWSNGGINSHLQSLQVKRAVLANSLRMMYYTEKSSNPACPVPFARKCLVCLVVRATKEQQKDAGCDPLLQRYDGKSASYWREPSALSCAFQILNTLCSKIAWSCIKIGTSSIATGSLSHLVAFSQF